MFCESLADLLVVCKQYKSIDISCNFIDDSVVYKLKAALDESSNIIEIDVRNNSFSNEAGEEINDLVTKHMLQSKKIPYKKL